MTKSTEILKSEDIKKLDIKKLESKIKEYTNNNLDEQELSNLILIKEEGDETLKTVLKNKKPLLLETFVQNLIKNNKNLLVQGSKFKIEDDGQDYNDNSSNIYNEYTDDIDDIELTTPGTFNFSDTTTMFKGKYAALMNKLGITARDIIQELNKQGANVDKGDLKNKLEEESATVDIDAQKAAPTKIKIVKKGDTLSSLFPKNWKKIANLNGIEKPYKIFPGDKIEYKI